MKLIIDIPELFYNNSKKRISSGIDLPIDKYVANGTPYEKRPKGECEKCTYRIFTVKFADNISKVMALYGITSIEELQKRLQAEMKGGAE